MAKKSKGENSSTDKISKCSICMETRARAEASCSHKFCMRCITRWTRVSHSNYLRKFRLAHCAEVESQKLDMEIE